MKTQKSSRSERVSRRQLRIKRVISACQVWKYGTFITCFAAISLLQEIKCSVLPPLEMLLNYKRFRTFSTNLAWAIVRYFILAVMGERF